MSATFAPPSQQLRGRIQVANIPDVLYHYTTQNGLVGIAKSKSIWSTAIRFLNDTKEFVLAHEYADEYLTELVHTCEREDYGFFMALREQFSVGSAETFVTSFSQHGDLLSQWRGYGGAASGYSLGFASVELRAISVPDVLLAPCVYKRRAQVRLVQEHIDLVVAYYDYLLDFGIDEDEATNEAVAELQSVMALLSPIIKDRSFEEEAEWRLIVSPVPPNDPKVDFRAGRSMLIPYVRTPLAAPGNALAIESIIVGPTPHRSAAQLAVELLCLNQKVQLGTGGVSHSEIPFRDW